MTNEFYSTAAQVIVVLLLALTIERNKFRQYQAKNLYGFVSRLNQLYIYLFSLLGISICLLHLGGFDFAWFKLGKLTVITTIILMLALLITTVIMDGQTSVLLRRGYATVSYIGVPVLLSIIVSNLEFVSDNYVEMIFLSVFTTLIFICSLFRLTRKHDYVLELQEIIGARKLRKKDY